ncbi:hypothetical protein SLEP1_g33782 [Rubroshorea leprosula]|uniref:Uncharacterized protein n=1 Tax=Rubroshorea leprosula TaxID=152421 RepID=A0AAV5KHQ0_9ROSI|nr:hypothetical protein SLEP1_g33782 [Rubroshorea leprosula]
MENFNESAAVSTVPFFFEDGENDVSNWVIVSSSDTESDGVISLDDDFDSWEESSSSCSSSSSSRNRQSLGSIEDRHGVDQTLGLVQDLGGVDQTLGSIQGVDDSVGLIQDLGEVDETLGGIQGHGSSFDQHETYYDGYGYREEEGDVDEDYDEGDEAYGLDDELVPWAVSGKFVRQRMRKLGKRACAKMHTSKRSPHLYVKPGCVRGKHGLGLKHNY